MSETILILDFGSQYTQLIARRVREHGVYSEIRPCTDKCDIESVENIKGLILSGGPSSVVGDDAPPFDNKWLELNVPTLGVCYGMQLIADFYGGGLEQGESREYGPADLELIGHSPLFEGFPEGSFTKVWMSHGDHVEELPSGFDLLAKSPGAPVAAFGNEEKRIYGLQFHPEVVHSERGSEILHNFLFKVAECSGDWTPKSFVEHALVAIRDAAGESGNVICGLSGGVDSSVAAALVHRAIGERLHCIFVDNGLMRKGELQDVENMLGKNGYGLNLTCVDAGERFLSELEGVSDPEEKRKIIGRVFIEVFDDEAAKIENVTHLVQGTLYPDVIESVSVRGPSAVIKSHHNVGGLPEKMKLKLIEPFRELFKDEVRQLGRSMDIPEHILMRQPFPGPGLAVRILEDIRREHVAVLQEADAILLEEVKGAGLYEKLWQTFAVLLPVHSVGVMGDSRTYEQAIVIRAVHSQDGMTADWAYLPEELLRTVSNRIINEVKGVNRVALDISSKPPATIEWE